MELRIFLSSTFSDLDEERQHLAKKIFPAIRQLCRERGVEFTEIDLRWGVTEEESIQGKVIRICMEEIDRCRPYFIGIVGSRYGWVPTYQEIQRDAELLRRYPWIEDDVLEERSLVEMEFRYGALFKPENAEHAFFYVRREHSRYQQIHSHAHDESPKVARLIEDIHRAGFHTKEFSGPESLGEHIFNDLTALIETKWKSTSTIGYLERERSEHESFAATRRHAYIPNPTNFQTLNAVASNSGKLVICGASGVGKSSLLAWWSRSFKERNPNTIFISHYVGIGSGSDHIGVLTHIYEELRAEFGSDDIPQTPERKLNELTSWLARLGEKKCVIVIDAVDQLDAHSHSLAWLPDVLPDNVAMILSTRLQEMEAKLSARGFTTLEILPLRSQERESLIVRYLSEYHKALSAEQLHRLTTHPNCANPLYLRTVLEELRLSASFDHLSTQIDHYLQAADLDELFRFVLERMEEDHGTRTVRDVMGLIWASRRGLSESDLAELLPISRMRLAAFLMALDYHLLCRDGIYTFFHDYLRRAVESKYASGIEKQKKLHAKLADYMAQLPPSERRAQEEPYQCNKVGDHHALLRSLTDIEMLPILLAKHRYYEVINYWRHIESDASLDDQYLALITSLRSLDIETRRKIDICVSLIDFLLVFARYKTAEATLTVLTELFNDTETTDTDALIQHSLHGDMHYYRSDFLRASQEYQRALEISTRIQGEHHSKSYELMINLGTIYTLIGKSEEGLALLLNALALYEKHTVRYYDLYCELLGNISYAYRTLDQLEEGKVFAVRSYEFIKEYEGIQSPKLIDPLINIGFFERVAHNYQDAIKWYEEGLALSKKYYGVIHRNTATLLRNMSVVYFHLGDYETALSFARESFTIITSIYGAVHEDAFALLQYIGLHAKRKAFQECALEMIDSVVGSLDDHGQGLERYVALREEIVSQTFPEDT